MPQPRSWRKLLRSRSRFAAKNYPKQPEEFFDQEITRFDGMRLTRLEMLQFVKEHELTHRSQLFMLMRLKGMVPPTTKRRMAAAAAAKG